MGKHYAFFQNKTCEYFPCHKGVEEESFNCLFCYCPLYMLGKNCGGDFYYTEKGIKVCSNCNIPHEAKNYGYMIGRYGDICKEMSNDEIIYKNQKALRYGITTGTCCAIAAKACAKHLLLDIEVTNETLVTPNNTKVEVPVTLVQREGMLCEYQVIKDSGDDPDVTNKTPIQVRIEMIEEQQLEERQHLFFYEENKKLALCGGEGVGIVTKKGLEQEVGMPAINVVPRRMIFEQVQEIYEQSEYTGYLLITVVVPEGKELAKRTFNGRLGIENGISILGTSGVLEPMSERAIVDTIEVEIKQLSALGNKNILVTPGNYGQEYASKYLGLDLSKSVKSSNYIGETIDLSISYEMERFLLVGNIGKLIKLAAGIMNTHSKVADARCEIMALHTILCGGTKEMAEEIMTCINTEKMLELLDKWGLQQVVIESICKKIEEHMTYRIGNKMEFAVAMFSEKYGYLGATSKLDEMLACYKKNEL